MLTSVATLVEGESPWLCHREASVYCCFELPVAPEDNPNDLPFRGKRYPMVIGGAYWPVEEVNACLYSVL